MAAHISIIQAVRITATVFKIILITRIIHSKLYRRYKMLTAMAFMYLIQDAASFTVPTATNAYALIYFITEPLVWTCYFLVLHELYKLILTNYPWVSRAANRILIIAAVLSIVFAAINIITPIASPIPNPFPILSFFQNVHRATAISVVIFLSSLLYLLLWYSHPLTISRNTAAYLLSYSVLIFSEEILLTLLQHIGLTYSDTLSTINLSITSLCFIYWTFALTPERDELPARSIQWTDKHQQQATAHLEELDILLKNVLRPWKRS